MLLEDAIHEHLRLQGRPGRHRGISGPPAVEAEVIAFQRRGHLNTAVAGYAVEMVLVALITAAGIC